jgi:hypothetical protein
LRLSETTRVSATTTAHHAETKERKKMKVRDLSTAAKKFGTNASAGSGNYVQGVQNSAGWAAPTEAAQATWAAGVSAAAGNGSFAKGVAKAGDAKWKANVQSKGQSRYQQAVSSPTAQTNWSQGFQPYASTLSGMTLPPRGVKGSPANIQRVQAISDALHKQKVG